MTRRRQARSLSNAVRTRVKPYGTYDRKDKWGTKKYGTSKDQRRAILERDGYVCVYCGGKASVVDHIKPVYHGGSSKGFNLVASCGPCNRAKGAKWDCEQIRTLAASNHKNAGVARQMVRGVDLRIAFAEEWNKQWDGEATATEK